MEKPVELVFSELKCDGCGAILKFQPGTNHVMCDYCGADNEIEAKEDVTIEEIDYESFIQNSFQEETQCINVVKCPSCAAETTLPPNVTSDICPFCATSLVIENGTTSEIIKPEGLLPFAVDDNESHQLFKKWLNSIWFAPNDLKKYAQHDEKLIGIYIPYWTYDANTNTNYKGLRGDDYRDTVRRLVRVDGEEVMQNVSVTKTRWHKARGRVNVTFDDVLVVASGSLPKNYVDLLEPFDLPNLVPFNEQYLSGFRTERYQHNVKESLGAAKQKMDMYIRQAVRQDIGGDRQDIQQMQTEHYNITFKHILLPIWISAYRYNGKVYRFLINGRTGKVQGERPYSKIKIMFLVIIITIVVMMIVLGGS